MNKFNKTIIDEKVFESIKSILGCPKAFNKANKKRKKLIAQRLKDLSLSINYTDIYQKEYIIKDYDKEFKLFKELILKEINTEILRKDSGKLKNKLIKTIKTIIEKIPNSSEINDIDKVLNDVKWNLVFYKITECLIDSVDNVKDFNFNVKINEASSFIFVKKIKETMIMLLTYFIFSKSPLLSHILTIVHDNMKIIDSGKDDIDQMSYQILEIYTRSMSLKSRTIINLDSFKKIKSKKLIEIPSKLAESYIKISHLPEIINPENNYETIDDHIKFNKGVRNGTVNVELSKKTKRALTISQSKKLKVNTEAIKLFKNIDQMEYSCVKNIEMKPFIPLAVLENISNEIKEKSKSIDQKAETLIKNSLYDPKISHKTIQEKIEIIIIENDINQSDIELYLEINKKKKELKSLLKLRSIHNTMIRLAEILEGFPIYYTSSLDYRLRMYPWNYAFGRTSGVHKYLTYDFKSQKVTQRGIEIIQKSLGDNLNKSEEEILVKSDKSSFGAILMKRELDRIDNNPNFKTSVFIELDQKSSVMVFFSLLMGNETLSRMSNVGTDEKSDPAKLLMNASKSFFRNVTDETKEILSSNRKIHKYLMMCFIYNEERRGRLKRCQQYIENYEDCNIIADDYPKFLDRVFNNITSKKNAFNRIISFYLEKSSDPIVLDTLDSSRIKWIIYMKEKNVKDDNKKSKKKSSGKKKYLCPISEEYKSFDSHKLDSESINKSDCIRSFMPGIIHSLDASIMRMLIISIYNNSVKVLNRNNNYVINHVHDCLHYTPSIHDIVIDSIEEVYENSNIHTFLDENLLKNLRKNLMKDHLQEFDDIVSEMKKDGYKPINLKENKINVNNMFVLE